MESLVKVGKIFVRARSRAFSSLSPYQKDEWTSREKRLLPISLPILTLTAFIIRYASPFFPFPSFPFIATHALTRARTLAQRLGEDERRFADRVAETLILKNFSAAIWLCVCLQSPSSLREREREMTASMERSLDAWEEVQRQGQDIADRFNSMAQGFTCLLNSRIKPSAFPWPPMPQTEAPNLGFPKPYSGGDGVSAILDIGNRLGRVGAEFGAYVGGMVENFFHQLPQLRAEEKEEILGMAGETAGGSPFSGFLEFEREEEEKDQRGWRGFGQSGTSFSGPEMGNLSIPEAEESVEEELFGLDVRSTSTGRFARSQVCFYWG